MTLEAPSTITRMPPEGESPGNRLLTPRPGTATIQKWEWIVYVLLACVTFAVYLPVKTLDFVNYDDMAYVTANPFVSNGLTWKGVIWAFRNSHSSNWHPATWISHMVDCQLYGLRPAGHHMTNALFHIANSLLVLRLLKGLTGAFWRSAFVAGLFALHPLRVESVAWVAERKDVLSGFFGLLCLLAYARYAVDKAGIQHPKSEVPKWMVYYVMALALFALGLMSKPMLVTWPLAMLLLDFWPLNRLSGVNGRDAFRRVGKLFAEKIPFIMLSAGSSVITLLAQRQGGAVVPVETFPLVFRIENAVMSYVRYIGKLFYPHNMTVVYPKVAGWPIEGVLLAGIVLVVVSLFVLANWRRGYLLTGWCWFLVTLVPVIGLIKVGEISMADRYTYLPALGIFVLFTWGISDFANRWLKGSIPLAVGAAGILIVCGIITSRQIPVWRNAETLFQHALAVTGKNALADINLGVYYTQQGQLNRAREHYESALAVNPGYAEPWIGFGYILAEENRYEEAISQYEKALKLKPRFIDTRINFGKALFQVGKTNEAIEQFREAVRLDPNDALGHYNLGFSLFASGDITGAIQEYRFATDLNPGLVAAWYNFGNVLANEGKTDEAMACYRKAIEIAPGDLAPHERLGELLLSQDKNDQAAKEFSAVVQKNADDPAAHYQLALALTGEGKSREAVEHYRRGLKSFEQIPAGLNNLAWILATYPDAEVRNGSEAVALAEKACNLTEYKQPIFIGTLAAALAEVGRFSEAVAMAKKAQSLAEAAHSEELASKNAQLMELYQAGKPFRDVP